MTGRSVKPVLGIIPLDHDALFAYNFNIMVLTSPNLESIVCSSRFLIKVLQFNLESKIH